MNIDERVVRHEIERLRELIPKLEARLAQEPSQAGEDALATARCRSRDELHALEMVTGGTSPKT